MTALLVLLLFVGFVLIDIGLRAIQRRADERRLRREREAVLDIALRLDFAEEAATLKRVEVPEARARILAVDDEKVVLESLRKILVLGGFSVDTVESGPEALTLVRERDYDFVFTDLKMPGMDGVEVVKAVHHLRPDVDLAVITGYATIETAVETMQHGAVDYVQKPFTPDEMLDFAKRLLIKRQARLEAQREPTIHIAAPEVAESAPAHEYCVPGGAFVSAGHAWVRLESDGSVRVGVDDFARKALGQIDSVSLPTPGTEVSSGDPLFSVGHGVHQARFLAPLGGRVVEVNADLTRDARRVEYSPYVTGWACRIEPNDLSADLETLRIGAPVVSFYRAELKRLREAVGEDTELGWDNIERLFLRESRA